MVKYKRGIKYTEKDINEKGAFNKNMNMAVRYLRIRDKYDIKTIVETGTNHGRSTEFFVNAFEKVYTVDILEEYVIQAKEKFKNHHNIECICGNSKYVLNRVCNQIDKSETVMFFLDAHGNYIKDVIARGLREDTGENDAIFPAGFNTDVLPVKQEIETIAKYFKDKCIIIVDDVYNPEKDSAFLKIDSVRLDYSYLKDAVDGCYTSYKYEYLWGNYLHPAWPKSALLIEPDLKEL